jgi:acetyl esterase/lipase
MDGTVLRHGFRLAPQPPPPVPAAEAYADAALAASAASMPGVRALRDIAWGPEPWQRLDLFLPEAPPASPCPVLVFLHGGGWVSGYKEWCGFMAPGVLAAGAILAAPTYRLAPAHRYPVFLRDSLEALAALRALVASHGGDPERLLLSGHSAGGHLAALMGLRADLALAAGIPPGAIRGVLPVSGILDLRHPAPLPGSLEAMVYNTVLARAEEDAEASPLHWAARARIPFHLAWGARDTDRVRRSNQHMAAELEQAGQLLSADCHEELDHFGTHLVLRDPGHPWYARLRSMIRRISP